MRTGSSSLIIVVEVVVIVQTSARLWFQKKRRKKGKEKRNLKIRGLLGLVTLHWFYPGIINVTVEAVEW